jgi:hypothetical protein
MPRASRTLAPQLGSAIERVVQPVVKSPSGQTMSWSVLWYVADKDRIMRHRCGSNLSEAIRVYNIVLRAGKDRATLRCDNTGFPPPEGYQKTRRENWGTRREPNWVLVLYVMEAANREGFYWCPYCREFRKFQLQRGFLYDGRWVEEPDKRGGMYCPMCGISHRDFHVRRWNPMASRHYMTGRTKRRGAL